MKEGANILLALMQLDIGGAETHVVELAKELKRRGFNVIVTSNGGVYVKELEEGGIKHYSVPLQNKKPWNMIKAAGLLKRIIKEEKIDLVHSHARIPSFILGKLHKSMGFPFVTTAHWVFKTGYGLKYITDWGEKCVAVSEDIKTYLMDNYHVPEGDIQVTINGIDTDKFSPDTDIRDIKDEFNIRDDERVIVYVSRMDEDRSLVAKQLIKGADELIKQIENLRIIVVGGGNDFDNVKNMADEVNKRAKREVITLTGARTDINKLVAAGELFIGVSRAALEAMAAQKPVIIAGNEGYIGLFDESRLSVGIATNFCCRGCEQSSTELIVKDVLSYFNRSYEDKKSLGEYGRDLIKREYSVTKMANDSIRVYDWALSKQDEILISGYYGFRNSGDDALLMSIIDDLKKYKESPNITVLSANPAETERIYRVKAINRLNPFKVISHIKNADMLISGGGTLIQDSTSTKSLLYYLSVIRMATKAGTKVMLYSNGIGPLNRKMNIKKTKKVLDDVDLITLRDKASYDELNRIGVSKPKMLVTADPAFILDGADKTIGWDILEKAGVPKGKRIMGISVRRWYSIGDGFEEIIAEVCDYAAEKYGLYPVLVPMQKSKDLLISQNIKKRVKHECVILEGERDVRDVIAINGCMDVCIAMRLHMLIYSAINATPIIGIAYDPKISRFMEDIGQDRYIDIKHLDADRLKKMVDDCMENQDKIRESLNSGFEALKDMAEKNGQLAIELYEKGSVAL